MWRKLQQAHMGVDCTMSITNQAEETPRLLRDQTTLLTVPMPKSEHGEPDEPPRASTADGRSRAVRSDHSLASTQTVASRVQLSPEW